MTTTHPPNKLSRWQKIGYGLGDIYGGGSGVIVSFYYLILLLALALLFAWRFPLTSAVHQRLNRVLTARRSGEPESDQLRHKAGALEQLLFGN